MLKQRTALYLYLYLYLYLLYIWLMKSYICNNSTSLWTGRIYTKSSLAGLEGGEQALGGEQRGFHYLCKKFYIKNQKSLALMAHAYNPSYSRGRDQENCSSKPGLGK
jgi:hypothetical protein